MCVVCKCVYFLDNKVDLDFDLFYKSEIVQYCTLHTGIYWPNVHHIWCILFFHVYKITYYYHNYSARLCKTNRITPNFKVRKMGQFSGYISFIDFLNIFFRHFLRILFLNSKTSFQWPVDFVTSSFECLDHTILTTPVGLYSVFKSGPDVFGEL